MSILSKLLLPFMRCYFLSLPFFSAGHVNTLLFIKIGDNSRTAVKSQGGNFVCMYFKSTTPMLCVVVQCSTFRTVCSIRWLQSALIPFVTTQSVRQNYTSVYSFDCKLWLCHNIAAVRNHRRPWR